MIRLSLLVCSALLLFAVPLRAEVKIQEVVSPGGLTAWLVQEPSIPFLALEIRFRGGGSLDAPDKRGAVNLMTALLEEGADDLDARGFARAAEELAASFSYDVTDDSLSVSARFLTENREAAVALLRSSLLSPRFDQDAIDRVREQVLTNIRSDAKDPEKIAALAWRKIAFGDHPYGSSLDGTVESVSALTREDLVAAHRNVLIKDRLYIGATGDISAEEFGALLDALLADLPEGGTPLPPEVALDLAGGITVVPFDTPQSVAVFGHAGIAQDDPSYFTARVLNRVLGGGGFESRLMTEVREKRGLTYGVYTYLATRDLAGTFQGQVASANDRIAEALSVIQAEWAKAARQGITPEELEAAKTYITGAYPLQFDGNAQIARILVGMQMLGLPLDYIETRNDKVEAVTLDGVRQLAAELLDPEGLHFVVVGRPEGLETGPLPN